MWVIYFDPLDHPKKFVTRRWKIGEGRLEADLEAFVSNSLEEARSVVPLGATRLNRAPADEAQIVEMWF